MTKKCICRELSFLNSTEFYGHFVFTSLDPGEGLTLGNMVRRTLMSKLSGSKIVGIKLSNINHEFSEVGGIREDILEIFLNLKEVIIKNPLNYSVCYGKLQVKGPAIVTAGLINLPKGVSILNPQHYLFTVSEQIFIDLEVKIEQGKSYILATDRKLDNKEGFLPLDANFTPILNVEYYIQPIVEYFEKSFEELHLIISTNGTILPQEALLLATNNLSKLILACRNIESLNLERKIPKEDIKIKKTNVDNVLRKGSSKKESKRTNSNKNLNESKQITTNLTKPFLYDSNFDNSQQSTESSLNTNFEVKNLNNVNKNEIQLLTKGTFFKKKKDSNIIQTPTKTLDLRTIDIEITCLPNRIITSLRKAKINVMADLLNYSSHDLQKIKGLGPISIAKIKTQINLFFEAISL